MGGTWAACGGPVGGMLVISVSVLLEIAVRIIEDKKYYFRFSQKIMSELLGRLNYWSRYGIICQIGCYTLLIPYAYLLLTW